MRAYWPRPCRTESPAFRALGLQEGPLPAMPLVGTSPGTRRKSGPTSLVAPSGLRGRVRIRSPNAPYPFPSASLLFTRLTTPHSPLPSSPPSDGDPRLLGERG